jgi:hypothetical protein
MACDEYYVLALGVTMFFKLLSVSERIAVRDAIIAVLVSPDYYPDEFHSRFGVDFLRMKKVLRTWPELEETDKYTELTISGCLNVVCNGIAFKDDPDVCGMTADEWPKWFSVPKEVLCGIYERWLEWLNNQRKEGE